jgi:hypothetical protein
MPAHAPAGMQRIMIQGIPVWRNGDKDLFAYDHTTTANPLRIGNEATGFSATWKDLFEPRLQAYRESLQPRSRMPAAPSKK